MLDSRKPNKLYSFLARSKNDQPLNMHDLSRSKPVSRRPISSNTATTITPSTPKQAYVPDNNLSSSRSRPTTPKPSATRQKLHDLFRIPLGRSRSRSRSRSRPSSPQLSLDIPPLPPPHDDDSTPRPRRSQRISPQHSPSPTTPRQLRVTNATPSLASTTAPSLKIPNLLSSRNLSAIDHNRTTENTFSAQSVVPPLVSAPLKRVSSLHRHSLKPINYIDTDPRPLQTPNLMPPQIIHTPPTPLKTTKPKSGPARLGYHALKGSLDSAYKYHGTTIGVVGEEGRPDPHSKSNIKTKPIDPEPLPRPPMKMSSAARSMKHGSFDFERPGWGASPIQRTGSNGTTGTTASERSKNADSVHDSIYGPGLAGVGTLQRDASVKRSQEREEKMLFRDSSRKQTVPADRETAYHSSSTKGTPHGSATPSEHLHPSTSTTGKSNTTTGTEKSAANTGKSSSMSKASGKRATHKTASGSSVARFIGLNTQHGLFSFEPPVPSPTRSTGSSGTTHEVQVSWSKTEKERLRLRDEKEKQQSKDKKRGDRPPVPVPIPSTNAGHRSGTKGRSLDLGLGLAWAPSKVREEALLPSSTFFARSLSNSSSNRSRSGSTATGKSVSSSTTGNGSGRPRAGMGSLDPDVQRSKLGKEVAELFRHAVDPEGYAAFRNYVHQFDAHEIPFDGPTGIVARVERLLASAPGLGDDAKLRLLDKFIRIILQQT